MIWGFEDLLAAMPPAPEETERIEFLGATAIQSLNFQQRILFADFWNEFIEFLRTCGKNPARNEGYADVRSRVRRVYQVFKFYWDQDRIIIQLSPEHASEFVEKLSRDEIETHQGNEYAEGSKRKFANALESYFRFLGQDWSPPINFVDEEPSLNSDPFTRNEREQLLDASLNQHQLPNYHSVSPEQRDRWTGYLAQYLGKPKEDITKSDWERIERSWKVPSLISTALDAGWRGEMVRRLCVDHVDLENGRIVIPADVAVKNNRKWIIELSTRSVKILGRWLQERSAKKKYDDSELLWLNRSGNPYSSKNLNYLLNNLIDSAEIERGGRKLTWHSLRHSLGTYVYDQTQDLGLVAEILRQTSLESARKYAHPIPESKKDVIESIQGAI